MSINCLLLTPSLDILMIMPVTEVFFKYLKQREINRRTYHSIQEVQLSCFEYIEQFYNNYNPHSANNGLTPNQKEENYFKKWKGYNKLDKVKRNRGKVYYGKKKIR
jgi:hypothetical protein